jgi:hypothetical protein
MNQSSNYLPLHLRVHFIPEARRMLLSNPQNLALGREADPTEPQNTNFPAFFLSTLPILGRRGCRQAVAAKSYQQGPWEKHCVALI